MQRYFCTRQCDNAVRFVPPQEYVSISVYTHIYKTFLLPFSRYRIFTPFRKHVTSWLSSYRSTGKKEHAATYAFAYVSTMPDRRPWSVDCHAGALHANRKRYIPPMTGQGDSKFRERPKRGYHLSLIRSFFSIPRATSESFFAILLLEKVGRVGSCMPRNLYVEILKYLNSDKKL